MVTFLSYVICTSLISINSDNFIDCNMTRIAMSCYAATKHQCLDKKAEKKVARVMPKIKPAERKYAETEATIALDKYNGKLMNSIWGLYNR